MPLYALNNTPAFPPPQWANEDGLLAVGGDLKPDRLISAYAQGIFPWYSEGEPILWWSPDPRWVLLPSQLIVSSGMRRILRQRKFQITFDKAFSRVIAACAETPRQGQDGTWISKDMQDAYCEMHALHLAHSVEVWQGPDLVGGLYGISLGNLFFGESMFSRVGNASKAGFITLVKGLERMGFGLIDCQTHTPHLESLGAQAMERSAFLAMLKTGLAKETLQKSWSDIPELLLPPC
jgi:leucyl/phenylalanyl-tRNA--protein transferase